MLIKILNITWSEKEYVIRGLKYILIKKKENVIGDFKKKLD